MAVVREKIPLSGFDPEDEPYIDVLDDGSLRVVFGAMPPEDVLDAEFESWQAAFKAHLAREAGVPQDWHDRWMFRVWDPRPDTIERVRRYIKTYRQS